MLIEAAINPSLLTNMQDEAAKLATYIQAFKPRKPIDSVTHTVVFVVTYGAGISPNWTLISLATVNSPLASAQGVRTHTLLITLGPDTENTANLATQSVVNILSVPR